MFNKLFSFGEIVPGLELDGREASYPVLNERDVRAGAGLMLVLGIVAFIPALLFQNRLLLQVMVVLFFVEFGLRVLVNPKLAPFYALGRLIVSRQRPDYSGAAQKRFAWSLGLIMASVMLVVLLFFPGAPRALPLAICSICLLLFWLETSFGICVGCLMYQGFIRLGWIKRPEVMPACPGGACPLDRR